MWTGGKREKRSIEMIGSVASLQNETSLLLQVVETQFRQGTFHLKVPRKEDFLTELLSEGTVLVENKITFSLFASFFLFCASFFIFAVSIQKFLQSGYI